MQVIAQEMIDPDFAGVTFTINPLNGNDKEFYIEYVQGIGEQLVSGKVKPETLYYNWYQNYGKGYDKPILNLNSEEMQAFFSTFLQIQMQYGCAQDIEWAIKNQQLYILQSRPITSITFKEEHDWTNANMKDGGISSSIATPFAISIYTMMMNITMPTYYYGLGMLSKDKLKTVYWIKSFMGYVYWNLSSSKACLELLPGFNEKEFDNSIGIEPNYEGSGKTTPMNLFTILKRLPIIIRLKKSVNTRLGKSEILLNKAKQLYEYYTTIDYKNLNSKELAELCINLVEQDWFSVEGGYFDHIYDNAIFRSMLIKDLEKYNNKNEPVNYLNLISGITDIPHLKPLQELWQIAQDIKENKEAFLFFQTHTVPHIVKNIQTNTSFPFDIQIINCIKRYEFHSFRELDFLTPCWKDDPTQPIEQLFSFLNSKTSHSPNSQEIKQQEIYKAEFDKIQSVNIKKQIELHRNYLKTRELLRDYSVKMLFVLQLVYLELGKKLVNKGILLTPESIFYLNYSDVTALEQGKQEYLELIEKNKLFYNSFINYNKPNEIRHKASKPLSKNSSNILSGIPCSQGEITAKVTVISNIQDAHLLEDGVILVTPYVDPAWSTYLFNIKGLITETGGVLSHGAILCRELGIPCILGVNNATKLISNHSVITMNGNTGTIKI